MNYSQALNKAAALCSRKEYCTSDIHQKLSDWNISEKETEKILAFLKENNFLNEERFAGFYVRDKFKFNKWGKMKITAMLRHKGIPEEIIKNALVTIPLHEYEQACTLLLQIKIKSIKKREDKYKIKLSLIRFAQSRGFEYNTVIQCIDTLLAGF